MIFQPGLSLILFTFQEYSESTPHPYLTLHLDLSSGVVYDPFNQVKPYAAAFYMVVEPLEHGENFIFLVAAYAQAVVLHMQYHKTSELSASDMDDRIAVGMLVLNSIGQEVV